MQVRGCSRRMPGRGCWGMIRCMNLHPPKGKKVNENSIFTPFCLIATDARVGFNRKQRRQRIYFFSYPGEVLTYLFRFTSSPRILFSRLCSANPVPPLGYQHGIVSYSVRMLCTVYCLDTNSCCNQGKGWEEGVSMTKKSSRSGGGMRRKSRRIRRCMCAWGERQG